MNGQRKSPSGKARYVDLRTRGGRAVGALAAVAFAARLLAAPALADRAITPRFTATAKGNLVHTGNTLMTCPAGGTCASAQDGTATGGAANNNAYSMVYVDVDANAA